MPRPRCRRSRPARISRRAPQRPGSDREGVDTSTPCSAGAGIAGLSRAAGRASLTLARRSRLPRDLLHLGVLLHAPLPALAPDATLLEPTERRVGHGQQAVVDPDDA